MRLMKQRVLRVEPLEDRCLPSANVVIEWNQLALHAVGQARLAPVFVSFARVVCDRMTTALSARRPSAGAVPGRRGLAWR